MQAIINKQAHFSYEIMDAFEAGIILRGHEVKAVKNGQLSLKSAYVSIAHEPEPALYLIKAHISQYKFAGNLMNYDPERPRKLLIKKNELKTLIGKLQQKGLTIIPLSLYNKGRHIKLEIGIAKGKKQYDKRESIKKKDQNREMARQMKGS